MTFALRGYGTLQQVGAQGGFVSYTALRDDGLAVIVRTHADDLPTPAQREVLRRHNEVLSALDAGGVAAAVELVDTPARCALVTAVPKGQSLAHSDVRGYSIPDVLQCVIDVVPALAALHAGGFGHGGIDLFTLHGPHGLGTTAQLESPWVVDAPPSAQGDMAALARLVSTALARGGHRTPQGLERVLQAALTTDPARRYRSVVAFARDLERCRDELRDTGLCSIFEPNVRGGAVRWRDPVDLVGSAATVERVVELLLDGPQGEPHVVVVTGPAGIGRSTVLRSAAAALRDRDVGTALVRFEPSSTRPLAAPAQLVAAVVDDLMAGPIDRRRAVEVALRQRLGDDVPLAVALLPPLARLLGVVGSPGDGTALDMRARVERAAREVVAAFLTVAHPFVAVFDDAERADAGSLAVFRTLAAAGIPVRLLLAQRTTASTAGEPLEHILAYLATRQVRVDRVAVPGLDLPAVEELIADGLGVPSADVAPLAAALWQRSGGNPGLAIADLHAMIGGGIVRVDPPTATWSWTAEALGGVSDGIDEVDRRRVQLLAPAPRQVLHAAAVGGHLATPRVLAAALDVAEEFVVGVLDRLAGEHLLSWRDDGRARFHDDGLRRAALDSIDGGALAGLRGRIGRVLLNDATHRADGGGLDPGDRFDALELLVGSEHALTPEESARYVAWCEASAREAHLGGAYAASLELQMRAISQLGPMAWNDQPDRMFELHLRAAENALVIDRPALVDQLLDTAWAHDPTPLQRVRALRVLGNRWWTRQDQPGGLAEMHALLRELGERFPTKVTPAHVAREFLAVRWALRQRTPESFLTAPALADEVVRAKLDTMLSAVHLAYTTEPLTHVLLVLRGLRLTTRHGVNVSSSYFVAGYGLLLCGTGSNLALGVRYGEAGLALSARVAGPVRTMVRFAHHGFVQHWGAPLAETVAPLLAEYRSGLAIGRGGYAHTAGAFALLHALLASMPLDDVVQMAADLGAEFERLGEHAFRQRVDIVRQAALDLRTGPTGAPPLVGEAFDADDWLAAKHRRGELALIVHTLRAQIACLRGDFEGAVPHVRAAAQSARLAPGEAIVGIHHFQVALLHRLGLLPGRRAAQRAMRLLRRAAATNGHDMGHRVELLAALRRPQELARAAAAAVTAGHLADHVVACRVAERLHADPEWVAARRRTLLAWGAAAD